MNIVNHTIIFSLIFSGLSACGGTGSKKTEKEQKGIKAVNDFGEVYSIYDHSIRNTSQQTRSLRKKSLKQESNDFSCSLAGYHDVDFNITEETNTTYASTTIIDTFTTCKYNTQEEKDAWLSNANFLNGTVFLSFVTGTNTLFNPKGLDFMRVEYVTNLSIAYNKKFTEKIINLDNIFDKDSPLMPLNVRFDTEINTLDVNGAFFIKIEDINDFTTNLTFSLNSDFNGGYKIIGSDHSGIELKRMDTSIDTFYKISESEERYQDKNILYQDLYLNIDQTTLSGGESIHYKLSTIKPLRMNAGKKYPSSGSLNFYSNEGKTLVNLFVVDSNNIKFSVDLESDGEIDYTENMKWSDF